MAHPPATKALPSDCLERIYDLPGVLHAHVALGRPVSLPALVTETGYPEVSSQVDVAMLRRGLNERLAIVENWLHYAAEKDASWGWFFEIDRRGSYSVGLKSGYSEAARHEIADPWEACATFIKHELDAILAPR